MNRLVSMGVKFAAKKAGNKALREVSETYDKYYTKLMQNTVGPKPLNVGEREFIECFRKTGNIAKCGEARDKAIRKYIKTGKY